MCLEESLGNLHIYELWSIPIVSKHVCVVMDFQGKFSMTWQAEPIQRITRHKMANWPHLKTNIDFSSLSTLSKKSWLGWITNHSEANPWILLHCEMEIFFSKILINMPSGIDCLFFAMYDCNSLMELFFMEQKRFLRRGALSPWNYRPHAISPFQNQISLLSARIFVFLRGGTSKEFLKKSVNC